MAADKLYKIAFASLKGLTLRLAADLLGRAGSEENFFNATYSQLKAIMGFDNRLFERGYRDEVLEMARCELEFVENNNIDLCYFTDSNCYPQRLNECDDAPPLLYSLGKNCLNSPHIISVVGTRHATVYGTGFIKEVVEELSKKLPDVVVVSGLAYGIDVAAHKNALDNNMSTVGVLAHGLSTLYPAVHRNVAAQMVKNNGMLVTDYRHDARITKSNFLARNRIVAGVADCTIVVESARKGGAMVTARIASGYNRDVFALPGRTSDTYSQGCNMLIASNIAALIQSADDILKLMNWKPVDNDIQEKKIFYQPTPDEQKIIDFLTLNGEGFVNRIAVQTALPMHKLMGLLVDMEFKGLIVNTPGGIYRLNG